MVVAVPCDLPMSPKMTNLCMQLGTWDWMIGPERVDWADRGGDRMDTFVPSAKGDALT